jgi:hypothetical protein
VLNVQNSAVCKVNIPIPAVSVTLGIPPAFRYSVAPVVCRTLSSSFQVQSLLFPVFLFFSPVSHREHSKDIEVLQLLHDASTVSTLRPDPCTVDTRLQTDLPSRNFPLPRRRRLLVRLHLSLPPVSLFRYALRRGRRHHRLRSFDLLFLLRKRRGRCPNLSGRNGVVVRERRHSIPSRLGR